MSAERHKTGAAGRSTLDIDALRARYRDERDRRLRAEGKAQYVEVTGEFARYLDDPWADPDFARARQRTDRGADRRRRLRRPALCGARLREAGIEDFRIVEKAGDFGGTWYWNRYPGRGLRHRELHLPAAAGRDRLHADAQVRARARRSSSTRRRIGRQFGLYERALFQTVVTRHATGTRRAHAGWSQTDRGDRIRRGSSSWPAGR